CDLCASTAQNIPLNPWQPAFLQKSWSDQRMDKSCTRCKDYVAHQYWDHMDNRKKRFFKLMLGNFRNGVTIPEKFVRSVGGMISELVKLETPDGNTYNVHIAKELNNLVLRSGWSKFASVYELQEGDLLRFKYNGDSHFKVEIYDPSACEKEIYCVVMNHNPGLQKRSVPHDNQMLSPEGERLAKRQNGCCSDGCKTSEMNPAGSPHKPTKKEVPSSEDARSSGERKTFTRSHYFLATGCNLTDAHKVEVDKIEQNIRPEIPLYVKTMSSASLVDGFLVISHMQR
uniref:TF-B3 domain-containing protein n=3 Tax=Triticinae TaxID=1648030 RepID=A0A453JTJ7_AEGTS